MKYFFSKYRISRYLVYGVLYSFIRHGQQSDLHGILRHSRLQWFLNIECDWVIFIKEDKSIHTRCFSIHSKALTQWKNGLNSGHFCTDQQLLVNKMEDRGWLFDLRYTNRHYTTLSWYILICIKRVMHKAIHVL